MTVGNQSCILNVPKKELHTNVCMSYKRKPIQEPIYHSHEAAISHTSDKRKRKQTIPEFHAQTQRTNVKGMYDI